MAIGDDAAAAGMALVAGGSTLSNTIDTEINRTRDYIAQRTSTVVPVASGGTGATTAAGARTNLGAAASSHTHDWASVTGKPSTFTPSTHTHTIASLTDRDNLDLHNISARYGSRVAFTHKIDVTGDVTASGNGTFAAAWDYNITTTRRAAWIDDTGKLGHTASTRASKQNITPAALTRATLTQIPVVLYQYAAELAKRETDPGYHVAVEIGTLADDLHDLGLWQFVVYDGHGPSAVPVSVHYELLGLAGIALGQLLAAELDDLTVRVVALESA